MGHAEACPDINGPGCAANPTSTQWHDLKLTFGEVRLGAEYGIRRWLSIDLRWSLRIVRVVFHLQDEATRAPIAPPYGEELHHRTETIVGLTDPWLSLRASPRLGPWSFAFRAGLTLPVGSTVANPFRLGRQGHRHQHLQLGSGTVDPIVGVDVRRQLGHFALSPWLLARVPLYANRHGFRAGSQLLAGVQLGSDLWLSRWWFQLGVLAYHEQPERWSGITETEGNLGRTDLLIETSVSWRFAGKWSVTLSARLPVYSRVVGAQLTTPVLGELQIARPFDLGRKR